MEEYRDLEKAGFFIGRQGQKIKAVGGQVEIHIQEESTGYSLKIPVVSIPSWGFNEGVLNYIDERNLNHKGPGRFVQEAPYLWYQKNAVKREELALCALTMRGAVEKIGPKILRQMK